MPDSGNPGAGPPGHERGPGYERKDVPLRPLVLFLGGLALLSAAVFLTVFGLLQLFEATAEPPVRPPAPFVERRPAPGVPRLLPQEEENLQAYLHSQREILTTYGWVDVARGRVRMPIEYAMKLLAEHATPAQPESELEAAP